jgi:hypothetical protein
VSRREVIDCDRCEKKALKEHARFFLATDRRMDGAGSGETVGETIDLCTSCCQALIFHLIDKYDFNKSKEVVAWIDGKERA